MCVNNIKKYKIIIVQYHQSLYEISSPTCHCLIVCGQQYYYKKIC